MLAIENELVSSSFSLINALLLQAFTKSPSARHIYYAPEHTITRFFGYNIIMFYLLGAQSPLPLRGKKEKKKKKKRKNEALGLLR